MSGILNVLIDFLSEPSVLIGLIVLIGLLLQKKSIIRLLMRGQIALN